MICKADKSEGLKCCIEDCKCYFHLTCVVEYGGMATKRENSFGTMAAMGMLDKNEGNLLSRLVGKKIYPGINALFPSKKYRKEAVLAVCEDHNSNGPFVWCPCN